MAEGSKNADLGKSSVEESILNIMQDHMVTTNDFVDESVETDVDLSLIHI